MADDVQNDDTADVEDERDERDAPAFEGWKPPASQADLDKIIQDRVRRATKRFSDYESLKERAARADALEFELSSESEKAVKKAREEEHQKLRGEYTPRLVRAEFRAAAKGVLSDDQLTGLLEDLDLSRYVTDDGDVDIERISKRVEALAPPKRDDFPDLGGGRRGGKSTTVNMNDLIRRKAGIG